MNLPKTIDEAAEMLSNDGKISPVEAAQLKMWASAKPDKDAPANRFEAWKKACPVDIPDLWRLKNNDEADQ